MKESKRFCFWSNFGGYSCCPSLRYLFTVVGVSHLDELSELLGQTYIKLFLIKIKFKKTWPKLHIIYLNHVSGIGPHLCHLATFKLFDTIEMVTVSFVNSRQIITRSALSGSFSVKGKRYIRVSVAMSVSTKCAWFTALSLFDVRYAIATGPVKISDKVAMRTLSPRVRTIKRKLKTGLCYLICKYPLPGHGTHFFRW